MNDTQRPTAQQAGLVTLLFGLSLATALPPEGIRAPMWSVQPIIRSDSQAILDSVELTTILNRPTTEVGHGRVALGEVDEQQRGLVVSLNVFSVTDGSEAGSGTLVSLSVVRPDRAASNVGDATAGDLWKLAWSALAQNGIPVEPLAGLGDDAFLAVHGGTTAQIAWLAGDRLATASVTCLAGNMDWAIEAARSISAHLDHRLGR